MHSRAVIQMLRADDWFEVGHEGSYVQFRHPTKRGKVTVKHPDRDIPIGTLRSIYRQAGWPWPPREK